MFDRRDVRAAAEEGVLTADQANAFESFLKKRSDPDRGHDSENLRFLTNFNDVFLAIGMTILVFGVFATAVFGFDNDFSSRWDFIRVVAPVLIAAWALAEYFAGRRRLLLPSMMLTAAICGSSFVIGVALVSPNAFAVDFNSFEEAQNAISAVLYAGFAGSALAALAVHQRFSLPFALAPFAVSIAGLFYTAIAHAGQGDAVVGGIAALIIGLATLVAAVWFDMKDPQRASLTSDRAFWLHLAAAPQIIFGVRGLVLGSGFAPAGLTDSIAMVTVLAAFALVSVALNRRALIVSGLVTFAMAVISLFDSINGGSSGQTLMLSALLIGGSIVLLGGGWRTARRQVLRLIPSTGTLGRIFPPEPA